MITEVWAGAVGVLMASGVGALVFWKKQNGNGKHEPNPPLAQIEVKWPPELAAALTRLEHPQVAPQPSWPDVVGELERVTQRVLVAAREEKPEWASHIESDLAENDKRLERIATDLSESMLDGMLRFYTNIRQDLTPPSPQPELVEIAARLETIADSIPDPHPALTTELTQELAELPARIASALKETLTSHKSSSSGPSPQKPPPPPKPSPPRNLPRMDPSELPGTPSVPASYVAGTVEVPAGSVWSLLYLIQKQLSPNCPGTSAEFAMSVTGGTIYVGGASSLGGPLSETNYAYMLDDSTPPRIYRSSFPGNTTPVGEIQVLGAGTLHVEVQS